MLIYAFTEHFPNVYKPYFDTQFADFVESGHELRIFAFGKFEGNLTERALRTRLVERTRYLPLTLRSLPPLAVRIARGSFSPRPLRALRRAQEPKRNLLDAARVALLPRLPPDLCLIHNLVTAQYLGFLRRIYPEAALALYFHGGEVPRAGTIDAIETVSAFASVDRVFTNTQSSRQMAIDRGCPPEKIVICPVGFELDDYRPDPRSPSRPGGVLRLVSVGRVSVEKGFDDAIEAIRLLVRRRLGEKIRYRIVGKGPQLEALRAQVDADGLGAVVKLLGEMPNDAVVAEYRDNDVLLLPSVPTPRWEENQACVAQEAMLMKLAIVATRTGGVQESIAEALRPFSVEPHDPAGIADRVEALLAMDQASFAALGQAGRAFAERGYAVGPLNRRLLQEAMRARPQARRPRPVARRSLQLISPLR